MSKRKNVRAKAHGYASNPVDAAMYNGSETDETDALFSALSEMKQGRGRATIAPVDGTGDVEFNGWVLTETGLVPPETINQTDYENIGRVLLRLDSSMQWLIGDWVNAGDNFKWGETYQRLANEFGYEVRTLVDFAYVSRNVKMSVRYRQLSFGHHKIVASMEDDTQRHWLQQASDNTWSIVRLRSEIKASQLPPQRQTLPEQPTTNRIGHESVVTEVKGGFTSVQTSNGESHHDRKTLTLKSPEGTPTTANSFTINGFNHDAYSTDDEAWRNARRAFEDVRTVHMATHNQRPPRSKVNEAREKIRALIAHLHYIESNLEG